MHLIVCIQILKYNLVMRQRPYGYTCPYTSHGAVLCRSLSDPISPSLCTHAQVKPPCRPGPRPSVPLAFSLVALLFVPGVFRPLVLSLIGPILLDAHGLLMDPMLFVRYRVCLAQASSSYPLADAYICYPKQKRLFQWA